MNERAISLLEQMLVEQKKHTGLLEQIATQNLALIEALSDDQAAGADSVPLTYLSGAPCR
jgi:hypothetical protein